MNETRNISGLKNWDKNPRAVKKDDFERLKKQITELGQYKPLLITPDGTVLGGNMRLRAYKDLGITDIWVSIVEPKTEAEMVKYAISDNDRAGYYVDQELAELIQEFGLEINLDDYKVDLGQAISLADVLNQFAPDVEEDEAPEIAEGEAISKYGEIYQLGRHKLMCGDATKIEDVEKLMDGVKADIMITDPPYGYSYESNHQDKHQELLNDDQILDFAPSANLFTQDNAAYYIFCGWQTVKEWLALIEEYPILKVKNIIIWKKNNWSMGDLTGDLTGSYAGQYEMILFIHKGRVELQGERERDVWEFDRVPPKEHPTMKPVGLIAKAITKHLSNNVLDLFGGSGTTLIACEQTNRTCYMMELDPKYVDVIRKRYDNFIAKQAQKTVNEQ